MAQILNILLGCVTLAEIVNQAISIVDNVWFVDCFTQKQMEDVEVGFGCFFRRMFQRTLRFLLVGIDWRLVGSFFVFFVELDNDVVEKFEYQLMGLHVPVFAPVYYVRERGAYIAFDSLLMQFREGQRKPKAKFISLH